MACPDSFSIILGSLQSPLWLLFLFLPQNFGRQGSTNDGFVRKWMQLEWRVQSKNKKKHTFLKMTLRSIVYSKISLKYFLWFDRLTSFKIMYRINNLPVFLYLAIAGTEKPGWLVLVLLLVVSRRCPRRWWRWLNFRSITWRRGWLIHRMSDRLVLVASRSCSQRHWWWLIHRGIPWRWRQLS